MQKTAYIIDSMHYIFRAYYGLPLFHSPKGIPDNAVYGYFQTLRKIIREKKPEYFIACFDSGPKSFRNKIYPEYKANRGEPPEDLIPQFSYAFKITQALGIASFRKKHYEADDLIAVLSKFLISKNIPVVIITRDKDLLQLVKKGVSVWDISQNKMYEEKDVIEKWGVFPHQICDFIGLTGDAIDNIPGVPGIGSVTAAKLLKEFATLENIYRHVKARAHESGSKRWVRLIHENYETALLSRQMATLHDRIPLRIDIKLFEQRPREKALQKILMELGFKMTQENPL
jgi:DNA polymerase-1